MDENKLIKPIADWIASQHPVKLILKECADIIGEESFLAEGYYLIESCHDINEWGVRIKVTPEVRTHLEGGYVGCDLMDCDCIVDDITGIEDCEVESVYYADADTELEFDEHERGLLREELLRLWRK